MTWWIVGYLVVGFVIGSVWAVQKSRWHDDGAGFVLLGVGLWPLLLLIGGLNSWVNFLDWLFDKFLNRGGNSYDNN